MERFKQAAAILVLVFVAGTARAQSLPPAAISFQGYLTDSTGTPIDTTKNIRIRLYDAVVAGTQLWDRTYNSVGIQGGRFN
ncbi:MAG: hypothetical protein ACC655_02160, partial [Rhodothermia bacterium]